MIEKISSSAFSRVLFHFLNLWKKKTKNLHEWPYRRCVCFKDRLEVIQLCPCMTVAFFACRARGEK